MCRLFHSAGPTTVQMVSQNRPPPPMTVPVQVPQGQVVQPYVNESGTLTHVVLSPQQYQQLHAGQGHIHPSFVSTKQTLRHESTLSSSLTRPKSSDYSITVLVCKKKKTESRVYNLLLVFSRWTYDKR